MKRTLALFFLIVALAGCAAKGKKAEEPRQPSGFASADAKNIHDFLARYPKVLMAGDVDEIRRLYTPDARVVPLLGQFTRPVQARDLPKVLPELVAADRKARLRLVFQEPMHIEVHGQRALAQVVAELAWEERGQPRQAVTKCFFGLVRDENYLWKIWEFHAEPVKTGFSLPPQPKPKPQKTGSVKKERKVRLGWGPTRTIPGPAVKPTKPAQTKPAQTKSAPPKAPEAPPAPQDTENSPQPLVPSDVQNPQPLF